MNRTPLIKRGRALSGEIGAYLERLIETELTAGDRLPPERVLAESLNVSRTSVREAMRELEQRRLIARSPGRGTTVLPRSEDAQALDSLVSQSAEEADAAELRMLVEPQIAGLAASRATATDLALLDQTLAASHAGLSPKESVEIDMRFHLQLAGAARNPLLVSLCGLTNTWVYDVRARSHSTRAGRRSSVEWHRVLYEAVAAGDAAAATQAMVDHLGQVARLVESAR